MTYEIQININLGLAHKVKVKVEYERENQEVKSVKLPNGVEVKDKLNKYEIEEVVAECEKVYLEQEQEMYWCGLL